ncbi:hypothetical protein HMPREF1214_01117 [Bacteroides sp. HPS0048]|uniref:Uncharacterized protein n=1 Tax=Bacteroides nordii CL02T12C05 TaxID=997884 RepID=I8XS02_9BACE|nr:hypothetical protein HMPREF1068_00865 [Bacteroides nordii CL02T12C05]EOA59700.1 hypothetical protein HMPREF1214_01117 [Bacteroides sp. HPS0048]
MLNCTFLEGQIKTLKNVLTILTQSYLAHYGFGYILLHCTSLYLNVPGKNFHKYRIDPLCFKEYLVSCVRNL